MSQPLEFDTASAAVEHYKAEVERVRAEKEAAQSELQRVLRVPVPHARAYMERIGELENALRVLAVALESEARTSPPSRTGQATRLRTLAAKADVAIGDEPTQAGDCLTQVVPGATEPRAFDIIPRDEV
jgi:hypothetical protein